MFLTEKEHCPNTCHKGHWNNGVFIDDFFTRLQKATWANMVNEDSSIGYLTDAWCTSMDLCKTLDLSK